MAILGGIFTKRDKSKPPAESKSSTSSTSDNLQLSRTTSAQANGSIYSGPPGASSSKLMLGFRGRKGNPPAALDDNDNGFLRPPDTMHPRRFSSSKSESGHDMLGPPPSRSDLFAAYAEPCDGRSTRSLPTPEPTPTEHTFPRDPLTTPQPPPQKKNKGMFAWAHRDRKRSKPSAPSEVLPPSSADDSSFNLKSFRHVRPVSPGPSELSSPIGRPPSASVSGGLTPPQRPRENSIASVDSSQRISVAAFREVAARRSAANSPSPSSTDMPSPFGRPGPSPQQPPSRRSFPRSPKSLLSDSTSDESESEEEEEDERSAGSSTLHPGRPGSRAPASPAQGSPARPRPPRVVASPSAQSSASGRDSVRSRARASQSTSALMPNAAAKRASMLAAASAGKSAGRRADSDSDSDSSGSGSDTDSDDAPLARLVSPKRPGSSTSNNTQSSRRIPAKPLIDISGLPPPPTFSPNLDSPRAPSEKEKQKEKEKEKDKDTDHEYVKVDVQEAPKPEIAKVLSSQEKPSLNDRLARLAQSVAAGRSADDEKRGRGPPTRSQTAPMDGFANLTIPSMKTDMPEPPSPAKARAKPKGRSMSTSNAIDGIKDLSDPTPIVPTPIKERSPPPSFSVTSRPPSQLSLTSLVQNAQQQSLFSLQPLTTQLAQSVRSHSPASTAGSLPPVSPSESTSPRAPLIPDNGAHPAKGFTGGGLLANAVPKYSEAAPKASPASSATSSPALRAARRRSATMGQAHLHSPPLPTMMEETTAPVPLRAFAEPGFSTRNVIEAGSSVSSSSVSSLSVTSTPAAPLQPAPSTAPASSKARARSSTLATLTGGSGNGNGSSGGSSVGGPPVRPWAAGGFRGNSPASSTGDSSGAPTPITPGDGSEVSFTLRDKEREPARDRESRVGQSAPADRAAMRRAHRKSASAAFDEPDRGRQGGRDERADGQTEESRRRERRRSEAKAAIELGNIMNGRVIRKDDDEDDDEDVPLDNIPPRMSMMSQMMGMPVSPSGPLMGMNMNMSPSSPMGWQNPQAGMLNPQQFMFPMMPPNADPAYLAAHQQAMLMAKQAYQMAVAQQAMAAAEEEWERGSAAAASILSGGGGGGGRSGLGGPMPSMFAGGGFGMNMGGMGMGGWPGMMFPSSAQSMYAGSVVGSELGGNRASAGWGSRSAYGDPSGNDRASMMRASGFGLPPPPPVPSRPDVTGQQRPGTRPRTKTAPTIQPSEAPRRQPPPSSWKAGSRPT